MKESIEGVVLIENPFLALGDMRLTVGDELIELWVYDKINNYMCDTNKSGGLGDTYRITIERIEDWSE